MEWKFDRSAKSQHKAPSAQRPAEPPTIFMHPLRPHLIARPRRHGLQPRRRLLRKQLAQRRGVVERAHVLRHRNLQLSVEVEHEVLRIQLGRVRALGAGDVHASAGERQQAPVRVAEGGAAGEQHGFADGDLLREDVVVLDPEEGLELRGRDDAAGGVRHGLRVGAEAGLDFFCDRGCVVPEDVRVVGVRDVAGAAGEGRRARALVAVEGLVLQVLADGGQVDRVVDAGGREDGRVADAGKLEEDGRPDGAGGEDHFLVGVDGARFSGVAVGDVDTGCFCVRTRGSVVPY